MAGTIDVTSPAGLLKAGQEEVAALAALLAATQEGQSVHGARRRIKQLRSLLRLLRPALGEAAYGDANAALGSAADALAGHRRAEALVAAAAKLAPAENGAGTFWQGVADAHRAAHAADGDPRRAMIAAREAVARAAEVLAAAAASEEGRDTVIAAFLAAYRKARKELRKGLEKADPATLHEARKHVIHHLHQIKLLQPGRERRLAALERLREVLGDLNDLDELQQLAAGIAIPELDARLMRNARHRLRRRAHAAAERLFRRSPAAFAKHMGHAAEPRSRRSRHALQGGE